MDYTDNYNQNNIPEEYRIMSPWAIVGYLLLFSIPVVGLIFLFIFAFDNSYIARRNFARSRFCLMLVGLVLIIPLAFIVLSAGGDTTNKAQLAVFTNNFSQYYDRVTMDALNAKQTLGIRSENVNDAQLYYMVANGLRTASGDVETTNRTMPVGYELPDTLKKIYKVDDKEVVAYIIDDKNITGYDAVGNNPNGSAGYEFYGDTDGQEYHFITSNGHVFTLPGFALQVDDGTIQFYISNEKGCYYVVKGKSRLNVGQNNINGDVIKEEYPIDVRETLNKLHGIATDENGNETIINKYHDTSIKPILENEIELKDEVGTKVGRYTEIK
ncbi:MAG: EI24 domain-containing protein [Clostridia bacterium]|nr:EI24 domain-containing protein [Clostridia bacterium]